MLLTKYPRIWYHIQVPGGADSPASLWRDVRAVEGTGLENRRRASVRGFESHSLRQFNIDLRKYPRGRRGSPAKGVGWLKPARGFKSLLLRQLVASVISLATSYLCSALKTRPALILLLLASEPDSLRWIPVRVEKRKYPE